jgi:plasmid stability protein
VQLPEAAGFLIKITFFPMPKANLPDDLDKDLKHAACLHQRAVSDYEKCLEFNKIMADFLSRLEDCENEKLADKVMSILIECNPKEGSHCEKASQIEKRMEKLL